MICVELRVPVLPICDSISVYLLASMCDSRDSSVESLLPPPCTCVIRTEHCACTCQSVCMLVSVWYGRHGNPVAPGLHVRQKYSVFGAAMQPTPRGIQLTVAQRKSGCFTVAELLKSQVRRCPCADAGLVQYRQPIRARVGLFPHQSGQAA